MRVKHAVIYMSCIQLQETQQRNPNLQYHEYKREYYYIIIDNHLVL
jgi:hypothetical protein